MNPVGPPPAAKPSVTPAPAGTGSGAVENAAAAFGSSASGGAGVARWLVGVAGVFAAILAVAMGVGQWRQPAEEPWGSAELKAARTKLLQEPKNEALKKEIRELDLRLRHAYFRGLERNRMGAWLLLGAGVLLVVVARGVASPRRAVEPRLAGAGPDREQTVGRARATVLVAGAVCVAGFAVLGLVSRSRLPEALAHSTASAPVAGAGTVAAAAGQPATGSAPGPAAPGTWPGVEELARNWPRFRGYDGSGSAPAAQVPLDWDVAAGRGVAWKTPVPVTGYNSPVVWDGRVFLTGGDKKVRVVFCFDLATGVLRWQRPVVPTNAPVPAVDPPDQSGAAASSVATDGRRVFAVFASGELGALDFEGNLVWHKKLDFTGNGYGHASSLVVWRDRLFVQADQGQAEDGKSVLHAFDTATGNPLWAAKRPVGGSWTTPVTVEVAGKPQVITASDPWLMAHDPVSGTEIWRAKVLGGELAPSPIFAGGLVVAVSPGHALSAVKADGTGDVTGSHVVWKLESEVPDVPTPVVAGELLFTANTEGHVYCRELASGKAVWDHAFELEFQASPLLVGKRIYLFAQPGNVFVIEAGREFRQLAAFEIGEEIYASPAVAGDRLLIRTRAHLLCVGGAKPDAEAGASLGGTDGR